MKFICKEYADLTSGVMPLISRGIAPKSCAYLDFSRALSADKEIVLREVE